MSFRSAASYAFQQQHDGDLYGQSFVDPCNDFFDQFLTFETLDNESSVLPVFPDSPRLGKSAMSSQSDISHTIEGDQSQYHLSQGGECSWTYSQPASPQPTRGRTRTFIEHCSSRAAIAAISDSELLSLEGIHLKSPKIYPQSSPTLPPTPSPSKYSTQSLRRKKNFIRSTSGVRTSKDAEQQGQRSPSRSAIRKPSSPSKMVRTPQYSQQSLEEWSQRLANEAARFDFGFQTSSIPPMSPPPSARVSDASSASEISNMMLTVAREQAEKRLLKQQNPSETSHGSGGGGASGGEGNEDSFAWDQPIPQFAAARAGMNLQTPMTTPTFGGNGVDMKQTPEMYAMQGQHLDWAQTMPPDFSHPAMATHSSYVEMEDDDTPMWWPPMDQTPNQAMSLTQPAGYDRHQGHNSKALALQLQNDLSYNELDASSSSIPNALMIQMPGSPHRQPQNHQQPQQPYPSSSPLRHQPTGGYFTHEAPPPIPPHIAASHSPHRPFTAASPFLPSPPKRAGRSRSRPRYDFAASPCPSPTRQPPPPPPQQHLHGAFSTPNFSTPNLTVRKSRQQVARKQSEPALSASAAAAAASSRARAHSHQRSGSAHARPAGGGHGHQRAKSSGGGGSGGGIEFCNFTPMDKGRILSGVAPSGSSKTKARREKEAQERRRRLSEAALRAVERAGGDVRELGELMGGEGGEMEMEMMGMGREEAGGELVV